jgi:hypothetical protein
MSELERERHKNVGLERARDSWYQEWFRGTERIAELEAKDVRQKATIEAQSAIIKQADEALAERDRMLKRAWENDDKGAVWGQPTSLETWLDSLRVRAEEGGE